MPKHSMSTDVMVHKTRQPRYSVSPIERAAIQGQAQEVLTDGLIQPLNSTCALTVIIDISLQFFKD